jgi:hypothetical protein
MYSNKASKGRVDQKSAKIGFKMVSLLKFSTLHYIAYEAHFPLSTSYNTSGERIIALKTFPLAIRGILCLERLSQKYNLTSGKSSVGRNTEMPLQLPVAPSCYAKWPSESNSIMKNDGKHVERKALTQHYKMRIRITGLKYLISEEFNLAGPSIQKQSTVD